jgi:hypothetical protein
LEWRSEELLQAPLQSPWLLLPPALKVVLPLVLMLVLVEMLGAAAALVATAAWTRVMHSAPSSTSHSPSDPITSKRFSGL